MDKKRNVERDKSIDEAFERQLGYIAHWAAGNACQVYNVPNDTMDWAFGTIKWPDSIALRDAMCLTKNDRLLSAAFLIQYIKDNEA